MIGFNNGIERNKGYDKVFTRWIKGFRRLKEPSLKDL